MHPILVHGRRLVLYLAVFAQAGVLLAEISVRTVEIPRLAAYALLVPPTVAYAFGCLASWYLCRRMPLATTPLGRLLSAHGAAGLLSGGLFLVLGLAWASILVPVLPAASAGDIDLLAKTSVQGPVVAAFGFLLYSLVAAVHYLQSMLEDRRRAEKRAYDLELSARVAELRALKAQVDPHFLFNSLNAVAALSVPDPRRARQMCLALASFLRESLRLATVESIALGEEVALAEAYLAIERARFGARLEVTCRLADRCAGEAVPPLLLQPLVENAVKHGIAHRLEGGTVSIDACLRNGRLRLEVANPCDRDRPSSRGQGIGLANVARRLEAAYGARATLRVEATDDAFRVVLSLPRSVQLAPAVAP